MTNHFQDNPTVFGRILRRERIDDKDPRPFVYEDELCAVFETIEPKARVHLLIVPKAYIVGLQDVSESDKLLLGHLQWVAHHLAEKFSLIEEGFRVFTNAGKGGGQTVFHLHYHLVSADFKLIPKD